MDSNIRTVLTNNMARISGKMDEISKLVDPNSSSINIEYMAKHQLELHEIVVKKYNLMLIVLAGVLSSATIAAQKMLLSYELVVALVFVVGALSIYTFQGAWKMLARIGTVQILAQRNAQSYKDLLWTADVMDADIFTTIPLITMLVMATIVSVGGYLVSYQMILQIPRLHDYAATIGLVVSALTGIILMCSIKYRMVPAISNASESNIAKVQARIHKTILDKLKEISCEYENMKRLLSEIDLTGADEEDLAGFVKDVTRDIEEMEDRTELLTQGVLNGIAT